VVCEADNHVFLAYLDCTSSAPCLMHVLGMLVVQYEYVIAAATTVCEIIPFLKKGI
jgi:hypothetical protein